MASSTLCSVFLLLVLIPAAVGQFNTDGTAPPEKVYEKEPCIEKLNSAVYFSELTVSKYMVWVAAAILLVGVAQILVALFVFFADSLDIYMLLLNYCFAIIFCIFVVIVSGSGMVHLSQQSCQILSPLSCVALSVPLYALFLLSYSRFYAITWPFYYVDRFTVTTQIVICSLSWIIPILISTSSSMGLCPTDHLWEFNSHRSGFCCFRSLDFDVSSVIVFDNTTKLPKLAHGGYETLPGGLPATSNCFAFLILYVSTCLLLPLVGCIVCYAVICVKIIKARKDREQMTSSSVAPHADEMEEENEENPSHFSSMKNQFKKQSARISNAAKNTIPVSVMLVLTMYVLVAVPLSLVEILNNKLYAGNNRMFFLNPSEEDIEYVMTTDERENVCPSTKIESKFTTTAIIIDTIYSLGLMSLALSPWVYIQSTKSFHDKLWAKPIRKMSKWGTKKVRKSMKKSTGTTGCSSTTGAAINGRTRSN